MFAPRSTPYGPQQSVVLISDNVMKRLVFYVYVTSIFNLYRAREKLISS